MKKLIKATVFFLLLCAFSACSDQYKNIHTENFENKEAYLKVDEKFEGAQVKITQFMTYKGQKFAFTEYESFVKDGKVKCNLGNYGEWCLFFRYIKDKKVKGTERRKAALTAKHYNIAYLCATIPPLNFCLNMIDFTNERSPTVFALQRPMVNYDKLISDAYPFPLASEKELKGGDETFRNAYGKRVADYIGSLYRLNKESSFDFYVTDYENRFIYPFFHANGIPKDKFYVHLLSDGTASYRYFNSCFDTPEADDLYEKLKNDLIAVEKKAKEGGAESAKYLYEASCYKEAQGDFCEWTKGFAYAYVMAKEERNAEWNVQRARNLRYKGKPLTDKDYISEGNNKIITNFNLGKSLEKWQKAGRLQELKDMLHYSDDALTPVTEKGGKAFVFVGTREFNEGNLPLLIDESKKYFGEEYEYFYKGHPGDVLKEGSEKEKMLTKAGVKILDSAVPMEVYMFFNPKIYIGGYGSSTYFSTHLLEGGEEQFLCLWEKDSVIFNEGGENVAKAKVAFSVSSDGKITVIKDK